MQRTGEKTGCMHRSAHDLSVSRWRWLSLGASAAVIGVCCVPNKDVMEGGKLLMFPEVLKSGGRAQSTIKRKLSCLCL